MSGGFYDDLVKVWENSKIDGLGYLNPQEGAEEVMKFDSRGVESAAKRMNLPWFEQEAHENTADPRLGIARASVATGAAYAGANAGNWANAAGQAMGGTGSTLSGGVPAGLEGTMESALMDTGYTPSSLYNAFKYGPESGQSMGTTMQNYGRGLMDRATSPGAREAAGRYAFKQGMGMMSEPNQPPPPPPPPPRPQQQQPITPYMQLTEEQKMQLRQMGYMV